MDISNNSFWLSIYQLFTSFSNIYSYRQLLTNFEDKVADGFQPSNVEW